MSRPAGYRSRPRALLAPLLALVLLLGGLSGCGQTGPLVLPEPAANGEPDEEDRDDG